MNAGLHALIYGYDSTSRRLDGDAGELAPSAGAAITRWADIDTDLGHLDGCYSADFSANAAPPCPCPPQPAEACTELGADTAPPRLGLLRRARISLLERRLAIVRDELDRYTHLGAIGPVYKRNSHVMQLEILARIRELRGLPPLPVDAGVQP